jgi:hypothetical protein
MMPACLESRRSFGPAGTARSRADTPPARAYRAGSHGNSSRAEHNASHGRGKGGTIGAASARRRAAGRDGAIDFSPYSLEQLQELKDNLDRQAFPRNFFWLRSSSARTSRLPRPVRSSFGSHPWMASGDGGRFPGAQTTEARPAGRAADLPRSAAADSPRRPDSPGPQRDLSCAPQAKHNPGPVSIGASGAILGLLSSFLVLFLRLRRASCPDRCGEPAGSARSRLRLSTS